MRLLEMAQKLRSDIEIREPKTTQEFDKYYDFRWRILRKPWGLSKGTEQDELDEDSIHIMVIQGTSVIGCGRGHFNSTSQAQIRWMAVDDKYQRQGLGTRLLEALEEKLFETGAEEIILKAREKAVSLYQKHGYGIYKKGDILFGEIKHCWMKKKYEE